MLYYIFALTFMLNHAFSLEPSNQVSLQKECFNQSNMCTNITNQYENTSFQMVNEHNYQINPTYNQTINTNHIFNKDASKKGREYFESSLCNKLKQLQQKSTQIISKLPNIHTQIIKAQSYSRSPIEHPFLPTSSIFGNKLKIIRELQQKIQKLETNMKNQTPHEEMRSMEKEINLNFQNYYQEIQQRKNVQAEEVLSSDESIDEKEPANHRVTNKQKETQTSAQPIYLPLCYPQLIEVQIPYKIYKLKPIESEDSNSFSSPLLLDSKHHLSKLPKQSSIQNIITNFNDKFYPNLQHYQNAHRQEQYHYKVTEPQNIGQIEEKEQFHLPLDSYERCEIGQNFKKGIILLKKTDRSNISSSNSQVQQLRDSVWNKEQLQFNEQHLSLVKQNESKSQKNDQPHLLQEESNHLLIDLNQQVTSLTQQTISLRNKVEEMERERQQLIEEIKSLQNKNVEMEIQYLQEVQKMDQLREHNGFLSQQIETHQQQSYQKQIQINDLTIKLEELSKYLNFKLEEKETEIQQLLKTLQQKNQEIEEGFRTNQQMKKILRQKEQQYEKQSASLQVIIHELKEQLHFYKSKMQDEQGINLKFQEANLIKDLIQHKSQSQQQVILVLQKQIQSKYKDKITKLTSQKEILQNQIFNKQHSCGNAQQMSIQTKGMLDKRIQQLLTTYNSELYKKDEEINELRKLSNEYKDLTQTTSQKELHIINNIKNILIKEKIDQHNISNNMVQFIYIVDRLISNIKVYSYAANNEKEQRLKLTKKITSINLYFNRELQKSQQSIRDLSCQIKKLKQQIVLLNKQKKRLTTKLQVYNNKLSNSPASIHHVLQLQNQYLSLQNARLFSKCKKMKQYCAELESKMLDSIVEEGVMKACPNTIKEQEEYQNKLSSILEQIKDEYNKSVVFSPQQCETKSKINHFQISSSVISITNKPKNQGKHSTIKALAASIPEIQVSSPVPALSITLDKLLQKKLCTSDTYKQKVMFKLIVLAIELNKVSKKLFPLKPCQILINYSNDQVEIILRREFGNSLEQDQNSLIYRAPQVLLGFNQSESSYVWTIGLIMDQIYHQKIFYRKINEVLSRQNNYHVRNENIKMKPLLQKMLLKNHKERPSIMRVKDQFQSLLS